MQIKSNQTVFLLGHKSGIAQEIDSVVLELSIALTREDAVAKTSDSFLLAIPAGHAEKLISSIQVALLRLRRSN
jgi:hypothetical protein